MIVFVLLRIGVAYFCNDKAMDSPLRVSVTNEAIQTIKDGLPRKSCGFSRNDEVERILLFAKAKRSKKLYDLFFRFVALATTIEVMAVVLCVILAQNERNRTCGSLSKILSPK